MENAAGVATAVTGMHTAGYGSDGRALASVSRNGSNCVARCRTLGPAVSVLRLLGLSGRRSRWPFCRLVGADAWGSLAVGIVSTIANDIIRLECFILISNLAALFRSAMGPAMPLPAIHNAIPCRDGCLFKTVVEGWFVSALK